MSQRARGGRGSRTGGFDDGDGGVDVVRLSKAMSLFLRHRPKELPSMRPDGFCKVSDILAKVKGATLDQVKQVVAENDKQRFKLSEENGEYWIRANQGHSFEVKELELEEITDASSVPVVVHGTYHDAWKKIQQTGGLSRMKRQHMHFASGLPGEDGVISGMRKSAEVLVYVNLAKALADGIKFYRSDNGVILTDGINGVLPLRYLSRVVDAVTQQELRFT